MKKTIYIFAALFTLLTSATPASAITVVYEYVCSWTAFPIEIHDEHTATRTCGNFTGGGETSEGVVQCGSARTDGAGQPWRTSVNCSLANGCTVEGWVSCGYFELVQSFYSIHCPGTTPGNPVGGQIGPAVGGPNGASCQNSNGTGQRKCECVDGDLICSSKM